MQHELDRLTARDIAYRLRCDERTVWKEWRRSGCVKGLVGCAIRAQLAAISRPELGTDHTSMRATAKL